MKILKEQLKELEKRVVDLNLVASAIGRTVDSVKEGMGNSLNAEDEAMLERVLESDVKVGYRAVISDYFAIFRDSARESVNSDELFNLTVDLMNGKENELTVLCPNLVVLLSDYFSMLGIFEDGFIVNGDGLNFVKDEILESMEEVYYDFLVALRGSKLEFKFELYKDFKGYKWAVFEKPVEYTKLSNGDYSLTIPVTTKFFGESGLLASYVMVERLLLEIKEGLGIGSSLRFPSFSVADELGALFDFLEEYDVEVEFDFALSKEGLKGIVNFLDERGVVDLLEERGIALNVDSAMSDDGSIDIYDVLSNGEEIGSFTEFHDLKHVKNILSIELSENALESVMQTILEKRYGVDEFFTNSRRVL